MIRAHLAPFAGLACLALAAFPAKADVLEINADGARWIAGGGSDLSAAQVVDAAFAAPVAEVPAEIFVPDVVVANPEDHAVGVPEVYRVKVNELAAKYDLSPSLIEAMVWQESRWRHDAVSPVGAQGLAQLMPGTARDLGVDPRDPFANLEAVRVTCAPNSTGSTATSKRRLPPTMPAPAGWSVQGVSRASVKHRITWPLSWAALQITHGSRHT